MRGPKLKLVTGDTKKFYMLSLNIGSRIALKKLAMALLLLYGTAVILILAGIYIGNTSEFRTMIGAQNDTDVALKIAFDYPGVKEQMAQNGTQNRVAVKPFTNPTAVGYMNYSGKLMGVIIVSQNDLTSATYRYNIIVDMDRKAVVYFMPMPELSPGRGEITIPPGAGWYYCIIKADPRVWYRPPSTYFSAEYAPGDAKLYQAIVNQEGYGKLTNSSGLIPLEDVDLCQYLVVYNGTGPEGGGWNATVTWPVVNLSLEPGFYGSNGYQLSNDYYLVLINGDSSRDVHVSFLTPLEAN